MVQPRKTTTTILFTDLVNSTQVLHRTGDEPAQRIFQAHARTMREAIAANNGEEVKWTGGGLMVAFGSTADAVRCAVAMQQAARRPVDSELTLSLEERPVHERAVLAPRGRGC